MKEQIIYVACDGRKFEDEYECQDYENKLIATRLEMTDTIDFYTDNTRLDYPSLLDDDWDIKLSKMFDACVKVYFSRPLSEKLKEYIYNEFGFWLYNDLERFTQGWYYYDFDKSKWQTLKIKS